MVIWKLEVDCLWCNPNFHGQSRYNAVIFRTEEGVIFAKLVYVLACNLAGRRYGITYVQALNALIGIHRQQKDINLSLYRLCVKQISQCKFIPIEAIVCGALVIKNPNKWGKYFVVDIIDTDMFLWVRELYRAHYL